MPGPRKTGRFDIADIVRDHRAQLESCYTLSRSQRRVLTDIAACRTAALGGHLDRCTQCGYEHPSYNSCRNRHCPKCQALAQEQWIAEQQARMLDMKHFHVVFTLPAELRPLAAFAPRAVLNGLFASASRTLLEFGQSRLFATLGATLVLHTWSRDLQYHPHIHCIVTGGGLAADGQSLRQAQRAFLFPVKAMSRVFRQKMIEALRAIHRTDGFAEFDDFRDPEGFDRLMRSIAKRQWNVYAKPTFSTGRHVLEYLGRYTHRVGIANSRLLLVTSEQVTFRTKGTNTVTVSCVEFLRRFTQHVLPDGFHKIRHFGLYASKLKRAQAANYLPTQTSVAPPPSCPDQLEQDTSPRVRVCPVCGGPMLTLPLPALKEDQRQASGTPPLVALSSRCRAPPKVAA